MGGAQLARRNSDAYRARNNTPRDFLIGLAFLCCVFTCDATAGGIAHLAGGFSLRSCIPVRGFYEWMTSIRVNPQIQIAIRLFSSDIFTDA
jgi:hypothetical protein